MGRKTRGALALRTNTVTSALERAAAWRTCAVSVSRGVVGATIAASRVEDSVASSARVLSFWSTSCPSSVGTTNRYTKPMAPATIAAKLSVRRLRSDRSGRGSVIPLRCRGTGSRRLAR